MKKKNLLILLLLLFPTIVNAKPCTVVNGTGKNIGDEIACGSEHFYIIEKGNSTVKMLSKYNLYVGDKIDKDPETFKVSDYEKASDAESEAYDHCVYLGDEIYGQDNVDTTAKYTKDGIPTEYFCRVFTPLEYEKVKQSELAIGLYPNGNYEIAYPIYGSVYLESYDGDQEFDENLDMIPETSQFYTYLTEYKSTLAELGLNVNDIGFIKKSGIENFISTVTNTDFKIPALNPNDFDEEPLDYPWFLDYYLFVYKYNIKEFVPEQYKWLYGTSYWVGSATLYEDEWAKEYFDEFLSTVGDYCSYARGCHITRMGLGLRPVIEINSSEIEINYDYTFISGDNQELKIDNINEYTFSINGDYSLFESLKIADIEFIKDEDYTVTEGSTIITFLESGISKLNQLGKGKYEILVKYTNDKEVRGNVLLDYNIENPKTLDIIFIYVLCGIISLIGIITSGLILKKNKLKRPITKEKKK